jgi:hypothetical protein
VVLMMLQRATMMAKQVTLAAVLFTNNDSILKFSELSWIGGDFCSITAPCLPLNDFCKELDTRFCVRWTYL